MPFVKGEIQERCCTLFTTLFIAALFNTAARHNLFALYNNLPTPSSLKINYVSTNHAKSAIDCDGILPSVMVVCLLRAYCSLSVN